MANVVSVTIEGRDKASKAFVSAGKAAQAFGKDIESAGKRLERVGEAAGKLGNKLTVGVTAPLTAVAAVSVKAAMESARFEQSLTALAGGADEAATYIDAIKRASQGTVSSMDAMAIASRALSFGVVDNAKQMEELTEIAITLGRAQGLTATQAVGDLTTALSRQSPMILDNLGITLKLSEASEIAAEHAHEFGMASDDLTKAQQFQIAALVKGREVMGQMGGVQDDAAASAERLRAQLSDASVALGEQLLPFAVDAAEKLTDLVAAFSAMDESAQKTVVTLGGVAAATGPALKAFSGMVSVAPQLGAGISNVAAGMQLLAGGASAAQVASLGVAGAAAVALPAIVALTAVVIAAKKAHDLRADAMEREAEVGDTWTQFLRDQVTESESAVGVAEEYIAAQGRVADELENASIMMGWFIDEQAVLNSDTQQLAKAIFDASDSFGDYQTALEMVGLSAEEVGGHLDPLSFDLAKTGEMAGSSAGAVRNYGESWTSMYEGVIRASGAIEETGEVLGRTSTNYAQFADNMVEGVGRVGEAAEASWPSINSLKDSVLELGKAFTTGIPEADDMWNMVLQTGRAAGMTATELGALAVSMGVAERAEVEAQIAGFQIVEAWERGAATGQELITVTQGLENYVSRLAEAERLEEEASRLAGESSASYAAALSREQESIEVLAEGHDQRSARFAEEAEAMRVAGAASAQLSTDLTAQAEEMRESAAAAFDLAQRVSESGIAIQELDTGVTGAVQGVTALAEADRETAYAALETAIAEERAAEAEFARLEQMGLLGEGMVATAEAMSNLTGRTDIARDSTMGLRMEEEKAIVATDGWRNSIYKGIESMGAMVEKFTPLLRRFGELEGFAVGINKELEEMPPVIDILVRFRTEGQPPPGTALGGAPGGGPEHMQAGTLFAPGGLALVGEMGPELVAMPRGARVYPSGQTRQMLAPPGGGGGGGGLGSLTVNIHGASDPQASADAVVTVLRDRGLLPQTSYR